MSVLTKTADLLFPPLDELRAFVVLIVFVTAIATLTPSIFSTPGMPNLWWLFMFILVGIIYLVVKTQPSSKAKAVIALLYYAFFMYVAVSTMQNLPAFSGESTFGMFNQVLIYAVLAMAIIRGSLAILILRSQNQTGFQMLAGSVSDTQYRLPAFITALVVSVLAVIVLKIFYDLPMTYMLLSVAYVNIGITLAGTFVSDKYWKY